jgi:translation initiation factor 3 subunit M
MAIRIPDVLNFQEVGNINLHMDTFHNIPLLILINDVFLSGRVSDYRFFLERFPDYVNDNSLSKCTVYEKIIWHGIVDKSELSESCLKKIRILTLISLATEHLNLKLYWSTIANALEINLDDVQGWLIKGNLVLSFSNRDEIDHCRYQ